MTNHLMDLIRIDSISKKEKEVAVKLQSEMEEIGAECSYDDAGSKVDGNTGNLIVKIKANKEDIPPFFLSSHMDTVAPGEGIKPSIENGIMKSDGTTILGSDDKSGIAVIVEVLRTIKEHNILHGDIEVVFTICEEIGLLGAKYFDTSILKSKYGMVLDSSTPKRLVLKCPSSDILNVEIHGLEAHAGLCPENGISAIQIASEAIGNMELGRIDHETTANIGSISGGIATNIIPNLVKIKGEVRSHDNHKLDKQVNHMIACLNESASKYNVDLDGKITKPTIKITVDRVYHNMDVSPTAKVTQIVDQAVSNLGLEIQHHTTGGGL